MNYMHLLFMSLRWNIISTSVDIHILGTVRVIVLWVNYYYRHTLGAGNPRCLWQLCITFVCSHTANNNTKHIPERPFSCEFWLKYSPLWNQQYTIIRLCTISFIMCYILLVTDKKTSDITVFPFNSRWFILITSFNFTMYSVIVIL